MRFIMLFLLPTSSFLLAACRSEPMEPDTEILLDDLALPYQLDDAGHRYAVFPFTDSSSLHVRDMARFALLRDSALELIHRERTVATLFLQPPDARITLSCDVADTAYLAAARELVGASERIAESSHAARRRAFLAAPALQLSWLRRQGCPARD